MNNHQYFTSENLILRKFAKDRYNLNDLHKWKFIEYSLKIPKPFEFVIELDLYRQSLNEIPLKTLYCLKLHCEFNQLTNLPDLPYCEILDCSINKLTSLPDLPYCKRLNCSYNKITDLPNLPYCQRLNCYSNKLKKIPDLPYCEIIK